MFLLHFLGAFDVRCNEQMLPLPPTLKAQSLLAYLVLHRDRPQPRERLAALFWSDRPDRKARRSLATALWHIRRCFPQTQVVLSDARTVQFDPQTRIQTDVEAFEALASREDVESLRQALSLYRGAFLADFYDDWIIDERYRLEGLYLGVLERLMHGVEKQGEHEAALQVALRLLDQDPLREDAHRLLMRAYCRLGQRNAALKQYRRCREIVQAELGTEPMAETTELYRAILEERFAVGSGYVGESRVPAHPEKPLSRGRTPLDAGAASPLVGREKELTVLQQCWQKVQSGRGRLVLLGGEAGIGKTRLVQVFAERLRWHGTRVLWGHCYEFEHLLPYQPIAEILQQAALSLRPAFAARLPAWVLREVSRLAPEILECLAPEQAAALQVFPSLRSNQERARLFDAIARFLVELSGQSALLVALEDLHWATETTLQLLYYLIRRLADAPVLAIGSYRPENLSPEHPLHTTRRNLEREGLLESLHLKPLSLKAVEEMLGNMSGMDASIVPLARRLHRRSEGNPLFITEIVKTLFEQGVLHLVEGAWQGDFQTLTRDPLPLPAAVGETVLGRVQRLSEADRRALQQAAVLGRTFDLEPFNRMRDEPLETTLARIDTLLRHRLLVEGEGPTSRDFAFSHHLIQEAVYAGIPRRRRQYEHRRAAEALLQTAGARQSSPPAAELAHHFRLAGWLQEALVWMEKAAAQARNRYAMTEAIAYYGQALELAGRLSVGPEREAALLQRRAEVHLFDSAFAEAREDLERALPLAEHAGDENHRAEILLTFADLQAQTGDFEAVVTAAQQALYLAKACGDERLAGIALRFQGQGWYLQGQSREAVACTTRACEILSQVEAVEEEGWAHVLLATVYGDLLGAFERAQTHLAAAHALFRQSGCVHGRILADHIAGNVFGREGDNERAIERYERALTDARRIGYGAQEVVELAHLAIHHARLGDLDAAEAHARACRRLAQSLGLALWNAYGAYWLGHVACERGNLEEARQAMEEALAIACRLNYRAGMTFTLSHLSALYRQLGAPENLAQALGYAQQACEAARRIGSPVEQIRALSNCAMACLTLNRPGEALVFSEQAVALAGRASAEDFSQELLFNHSQVLRANGRIWEAQCYLQRAQADVMAKANRIRNPDLRRSFLENVRINRQILAGGQALDTV